MGFLVSRSLSRSPTGNEQRDHVNNHHQSTPTASEDVCDPEVRSHVTQFREEQENDEKDLQNGHKSDPMVGPQSTKDSFVH